MASVTLETQEITDFDSFHAQCMKVFGFPDFYGRNMNAWIDCLTCLSDGDGMSAFELQQDEHLFIHVPDFEVFRTRLPEVSEALLQCTAFVNRRSLEAKELPRLVLVLVSS